jgi:hypothetical protein
MVVAVIRKRRFLKIRQQGRNGLAQLDAEVVEVTFRCRTGALLSGTRNGADCTRACLQPPRIRDASSETAKMMRNF